VPRAHVALGRMSGAGLLRTRAFAERKPTLPGKRVANHGLRLLTDCERLPDVWPQYASAVILEFKQNSGYTAGVSPPRGLP
jgi:hypothetical protein